MTAITAYLFTKYLRSLLLSFRAQEYIKTDIISIVTSLYAIVFSFMLTHHPGHHQASHQTPCLPWRSQEDLWTDLRGQPGELN